MKQHGDDDQGDLDDQQVVEEASAYYASIGPWATERWVMDYCGISKEALNHWRKNQKVLSVEFADGKWYYPVQQFTNGHPMPGLNLVLDALKPAFVAPASQAGWLAKEAYHGDPLTRWDYLRAGKVALVVEWADEDTARVIGP